MTTLPKHSDLECNSCPNGSTTNGEIGATACIAQDPNPLAPGIKALGYTFVAMTWSLSFSFLVWLFFRRTDPVVRISQIEFLIMICVGAIISSSSILALSVEADVGEDTAAATRACMTIPFLYTVGWVLEYSSLFVKSYRLFRLTASTSRFRRVEISAYSMFKLIGLALLLDMIVVVVWTVVSPLEYQRDIVGSTSQDEIGVITVESIGRCQSSVSIWAFVGPLSFMHLCLILGTNLVLWMNRGVEDGYQESKYVAIASIYVGELLVIGLPVLVALGETTASARYIVFCAMVFLNDAGILCFIFFPKVLFIRKGLPAGVTVSQSVVRATMQSARSRAFSFDSAYQTAEKGSTFPNQSAIQQARDESLLQCSRVTAAGSGFSNSRISIEEASVIPMIDGKQNDTSDHTS